MFGAMKDQPTRAGFTLPEVLLATMLLSLGLGALASAATYIAAESADARRLAEAAQVVSSALDSLRSAPCATLSGGARSSGSTNVSWTVSLAHNARAVHAALVTTHGTHVRSYAIDGLLPCEN